MTTFIPALPQAFAIPSPMPLAEPVINATFPFKFSMIPSYNRLMKSRTEDRNEAACITCFEKRAPLFFVR
jgi:hypothetical protein